MANNMSTEISKSSTCLGPQGKGKLSWKQLQKVVSTARKNHSKLTNLMPFHFIVMEQTSMSDKVRLLSLGMLPGQTERTLLFADVSKSSEFVADQPIEWKPAFENYQVVVFFLFINNSNKFV